MKQIVAHLSLRNLLHARLEFLCNVALIIGVLVPLLAVLGAKNGINDGLFSRLSERAGLLEITTVGNAEVTAAQFEQVAALDGVHFATLAVRSGTDFMIARGTDNSGFVNARLRTTGPGDPLTTGFPAPELGQAIISADLADTLGLVGGAIISVSTGQDGRTRHAFAQLDVAGVLPPERMVGQVMLVPLAFMDGLEAYTEGYAVPFLGITDGSDLTGRVATYEGVDVQVKSLEDVGPVARQIETLLNRTTRSQERIISDTLTTQAYLDRAFQLIAIVGCIGLGAALAAAQVNAVLRQRRVLATLMLLGGARRDIAIFPILPAFATVIAGVALSLLGYVLLGQIVSTFSTGAPVNLRLRSIDISLLLLAAFCVATLSCLFSIRKLLDVDPAIILRENA